MDTLKAVWDDPNTSKERMKGSHRKEILPAAQTSLNIVIPAAFIKLRQRDVIAYLSGFTLDQAAVWRLNCETI